MTNKDILNIAMKQSAIDVNCDISDFNCDKNKVVISQPNPNARRYLNLPFFCDIISYGSNIVASVNEEIVDFVEKYINRFPTERCFETPNIHLLSEEFKKYNKTVCFMAEYFLPDVSKIKVLPCKYEVKILHQEDFKDLYTSEWSNALCKNRKHLDVLAASAFDGDRMIGMAACSADCDEMWQIGIDVLPEYRMQGVAAALTSRLTNEILALEKVPFYCAAWSNIKSVRNAIKCGFRPAWVELTAIDTKKAMDMIK